MDSGSAPLPRLVRNDGVFGVNAGCQRTTSTEHFARRTIAEAFDPMT